MSAEVATETSDSVEPFFNELDLAEWIRMTKSENSK